MIDIGTTPFECFKPIAHLFRMLKFERFFEAEWFFHAEGHEVRQFENVKEIHVVCEEPYGPPGWLHMFDGGHYWPCGKENMYLIDKTYGYVFRGEEGLDEMEALENYRMPEENCN